MRSFGKVNLSPQKPHHPASEKNSSDEHSEAVEAVTDLFAGGIALGDAENDGRKQREQNRGAEM